MEIQLEAPKRPEPKWHMRLTMIFAIGLQLVLAERLVIGPRFLLPGIEAIFLLCLVVAEIGDYDHGKRRFLTLVLIALTSLANISSLIILLRYLIAGTHRIDGAHLIISAVAIFLTNIIIFGLWYWELDGGGPSNRGTHRSPIDFLFPQLNTPPSVTKETNWQPTFFDYLYVSTTNATAFSPTDALPLTHRAKLLMSIQGLTSLLTIALVAARAINILA